MARERISLIPEEKREVKQIRSMIESGEINSENFHELSKEMQEEVSRVLFEIAESQVNLTQGISALEFILFAFIRIMQKKVNGLSLTAEDKKVEESLGRILDLHEITNEDLYISDWLFDYMEYAEDASNSLLLSREEHINRKKKVMGKI